MSNEGLILFAVLLGVVSFMAWETYAQGDLETVSSQVDGRQYTVRSLPDKAAAADLLATIRARLTTLSTHLQKMHPDDDRTRRIASNYRPDSISEGVDSTKYTSYSVNKGERIVFCLRSKDGSNTLTDTNTMMFVALHELAHIATSEVGHTQTFWDNFAWILEEAIQIGVYAEQDFESKPVRYCGVSISSSPLNRGAAT